MRKPAADRDWLPALKAAEAAASEDLSTALDEEVEVQYLGQKYGPARRHMDRSEPRSWKLKAGERKDHVQVCFRWQLLGAQAVPASITELRNDHARFRALVRPRSMPCRPWCARALQALENAANEFVGLH